MHTHQNNISRWAQDWLNIGSRGVALWFILRGRADPRAILRAGGVRAREGNMGVVRLRVHQRVAWAIYGMADAEAPRVQPASACHSSVIRGSACACLARCRMVA